mmetsp:Transcript_50516/g.110514  ORF Transcript_50516/g.110514 Transcript_50516/m.110514 type:complete len:515 (-) Transcript_50516:535-2079(-)
MREHVLHFCLLVLRLAVTAEAVASRGRNVQQSQALVLPWLHVVLAVTLLCGCLPLSRDSPRAPVPHQRLHLPLLLHERLPQRPLHFRLALQHCVGHLPGPRVVQLADLPRHLLLLPLAKHGKGPAHHLVPALLKSGDGAVEAAVGHPVELLNSIAQGDVRRLPLSALLLGCHKQLGNQTLRTVPNSPHLLSHSLVPGSQPCRSLLQGGPHLLLTGNPRRVLRREELLEGGIVGLGLHGIPLASHGCSLLGSLQQSKRRNTLELSGLGITALLRPRRVARVCRWVCCGVVGERDRPAGGIGIGTGEPIDRSSRTIAVLLVVVQWWGCGQLWRRHRSNLSRRCICGCGPSEGWGTRHRKPGHLICPSDCRRCGGGDHGGADGELLVGLGELGPSRQHHPRRGGVQVRRDTIELLQPVGSLSGRTCCGGDIFSPGRRCEWPRGRGIPKESTLPLVGGRGLHRETRGGRLRTALRMKIRRRIPLVPPERPGWEIATWDHRGCGSWDKVTTGALSVLLI